MKKILGIKILLVLLAIGFVCTVSTAHATLLGVKEMILNAPSPGITPDIQYDSGGWAEYSAQDEFFYVRAWDKNLWLPGQKPGPGTALSNYVDFEIYAYFDNGKFVEGYMIEVVNTDFEFTVGRTTYSFEAGDLFLGAYLTAIGWDEVNKNQFDYITANYIYGVLSEDYGLWPVNVPIGGYIDTANWGSWVPWQEDLLVATEKGDKVPVPEPATMLLLGSGLIGLAGFVRKRFKK